MIRRGHMKQFLLSGLLAAGLAACQGEKQTEGCAQDSDCNTGFFCERNSGACRCATNDSCAVGEYCNSFGACQARPPCLENSDCAAGEICNGDAPSGGSCISAQTCGSSLHCDLGSYCDSTLQSDGSRIGTCKPGCKSAGDCILGQVCEGRVCVAGGTATDCTKCALDPNPEPTYCDYGEVCNQDGACVNHPSRASLCNSCTPDTGCGSPNLVCLLDQDNANANYCGPKCETDLDCPSGYEGCGALQLVFEQCNGSQSCSNGGECLRPTESNVGICACVQQSDCEIDLCTFGVCLNDFGRSCQTSADCKCLNGVCAFGSVSCNTSSDCDVTCEKVESNGREVGICQTKAKACGKGAGVTCSELKTGTADCRDYN